MKKVVKYIKEKWYKLKRKVFTAKAVIHLKSPFYPPRVEVHATFFNKIGIELFETKARYTRNYEIDYEHLVTVAPVHVVELKLPSNWGEQVEYARATQGHYEEEGEDV